MDAPTSGLLLATLDNTASTFMTVTVKCVVSLEPLSQLATLQAFRERAAMHKELQAGLDALERHTQLMDDLAYEKDELTEHMAKLMAEVDKVHAELEARTAELEGAQDEHVQLSAHVESLWKKLQDA